MIESKRPPPLAASLIPGPHLIATSIPSLKDGRALRIARRNSRSQRVPSRPFSPPGRGAGSVANRSTISTISDRCGGESLINAFNSRRHWIVSLDGRPSFSLNSETDKRFFISRLQSENDADLPGCKYAKEQPLRQGSRGGSCTCCCHRPARYEAAARLICHGRTRPGPRPTFRCRRG